MTAKDLLEMLAGAAICGLFPLLFVPMFRRMEKERLEAERKVRQA